MTIITFLSDFGLKDEYVAVCKGVIKSIAPRVEIIDISHQIPKFDIRKGAFVLAAALPYIPAKTHLAVVDPGVGGERRGLAIQTKRKDFLVGPDNGLLILAAKKLGGIKKVVELANRKYMLGSISSTFHARDIFAPAAAYLAREIEMEEFGKELEPAKLVSLPWKEPQVAGGKIVAEIIDIDDFGTARLNCEDTHLKKVGIFLDQKVFIEYQGKRFKLPLRQAFANVDEGLPLVLVDSTGLVCIALNRGSARDRFGLEVGKVVTIFGSGRRLNPRNP